MCLFGRIVKVAIYKTVEKMPDVKVAHPSCSVRIANDVDGAAVAQQVIELRPISQLADPRQVEQQQPTRRFGEVLI